jgi:signal transduction histidine kinase
MSIILASDDLATRQAVNVILRKYDRQVQLVSAAQDVLAAADEIATPEKIILDTRLEMSNLVSLLDRIFQKCPGEKPQVFLLTHDQDSSTLRDHSRVGAGNLLLGGLADLEAQFQPQPSRNPFGQRLSVDQIRLGSEDEFMAVFLHAPIPIYLIDMNGQVRRANRAKNPYVTGNGESTRDIGYVLGCLHVGSQGHCGTTPECKQCPLHRVIQDTIREDRCFHRKEISLTVSEEENSEEKNHALASTTPLWIDQKKMILLFLEDVTELRRSQELLAEFNRNLENLVERRTAQVQALLEQKKEFIRQLGHDLRTPLTPLVALLPMLRPRLENPKDREMLELIINNTDYIRQLVAKTLDLMVLENDRIIPDFQTVDLHVEINNVLADFGSVLKEKGFTAVSNISAPVKLRVDVLQFKELLLNLLANAVKFSPDGGQIAVAASLKDDEVLVSVSDPGVGMSQEHLSRIFDEFYKVDPSRHDRKSLGLGLSICKRIVENHNGRIWAHSPGLDQGTTITFALPTRLSNAAGNGEEQA